MKIFAHFASYARMSIVCLLTWFSHGIAVAQTDTVQNYFNTFGFIPKSLYSGGEYLQFGISLTPAPLAYLDTEPKSSLSESNAVDWMRLGQSMNKPQKFPSIEFLQLKQDNYVLGVSKGKDLMFEKHLGAQERVWVRASIPQFIKIIQNDQDPSKKFAVEIRYEMKW